MQASDFSTIKYDFLQLRVADVRAFGEGIARLRDAAEKAAKAVQDFGSTYYSVAERVYLTQHPRLPGSDRNPRMQKKRLTKVADWYARWLQSSQ